MRAPEIDPGDWAGDSLLLGALRGKVVLLDFFSYGDPGSTLSLSRVQGLADHYRPAGLAVVGVHVPAYEFERRGEDARREIWRLGIPHPVALDSDFGIFRAYGLQNLPARVLIDSQGMVRGWTEGQREFEALEGAIRSLLRERDPAPSLPSRHEADDELPRAGQLRWLPTPEIRFGHRGVGFGVPAPVDPEATEPREAGTAAAPDAPGAPNAPPAAADTQTFEMPELRAEGRPYLEGRWSVGQDRIVCEDDEGGLAVVFEGASVRAVLAPGDDSDGTVVTVSLDGQTIDPEVAGIDLDLVDDPDRSEVAVSRGRVYELISSGEFGIHNLDLRFRGRGVAVHLLAFGTVHVPEAS